VVCESVSLYTLHTLYLTFRSIKVTIKAAFNDTAAHVVTIKTTARFTVDRCDHSSFVLDLEDPTWIGWSLEMVHTETEKNLFGEDLSHLTSPHPSTMLCFSSYRAKRDRFQWERLGAVFPKIFWQWERRSQERALVGSNSRQVVHGSHPCASVTKQHFGTCQCQGAVMFCAVGLASQWPCVTDSVVYPPTGSKANVQEMSIPLTLHWSMVPLYLHGTRTLSEK